MAEETLSALDEQSPLPLAEALERAMEAAVTLPESVDADVADFGAVLRRLAEEAAVTGPEMERVRAAAVRLAARCVAETRRPRMRQVMTELRLLRMLANPVPAAGTPRRNEGAKGIAGRRDEAQEASPRTSRMVRPV